MIAGLGGSGGSIDFIQALIARDRATGHPTGPTGINNAAGNGDVGLAAWIDHGVVGRLPPRSLPI